MELTNHQNRNRIEEQPTQWEDFKENHGTKMKFLFNIGITIGCIATMIYIFESNKSKYLLLLPIWILVMQVGYCCYALRKYIHADNNKQMSFALTVSNDKSAKISENIEQLTNCMKNIQSQIQSLENRIELLIPKNKLQDIQQDELDGADILRNIP